MGCCSLLGCDDGSTRLSLSTFALPCFFDNLCVPSTTEALVSCSSVASMLCTKFVCLLYTWTYRGLSQMGVGTVALSLDRSLAARHFCRVSTRFHHHTTFSLLDGSYLNFICHVSISAILHEMYWRAFSAERERLESVICALFPFDLHHCFMWHGTSYSVGDEGNHGIHSVYVFGSRLLEPSHLNWLLWTAFPWASNSSCELFVWSRGRVT